MAAASPAAVAIKASEIPGATTARLAVPCVPIPWNADMMPHTVPKSPMHGIEPRGDEVVVGGDPLRRLRHPGELLVGGAVHLRERTLRKLLGGAEHERRPAAFAHEAHEGHRLPPDPAKVPPLLRDQRPA